MSVLIKGMKMPENCDVCMFSDWSNLHQTACCKLNEYKACFEDFSAEYAIKTGKDCPLVEVTVAEKKDNGSTACFASDRCHQCKHCIEDEIETGLTGLECEEGMESFYNGSTEGCWRYEKKEDDDEYSD